MLCDISFNCDNLISGNYISVPKRTYTLTVTVNVTNNKFEIKKNNTDFNGIFIEGEEYVFDITGIPSGHSLAFSITEDGIHRGGQELINTNGGIVKNAHNYCIHKLDTNVIYYYCKNHANYGGNIKIQSGTSNICN